MLGIHRVGPGREHYYLADLAPELPAPGPGGWSGAACGPLGLEGAVTPLELRHLLEGRHPGSGHPLAARPPRVGAYDLTFSAPKSVSIVFALGGADVAGAVIDAHGEAVTAALRYVERHALGAARRSGPSTTVVPVDGAVAAVFTHGVSRNLDPHVHSHAVVPNVVHGCDGRWSAVDQRGLFAHRHAASAVYDAHLRSALTATLGARWVPTRSEGVEVAGVPPELIGLFSTRQADIRQRRHDWAVRSQRGQRVAWASTRPPKDHGGDFEQLSRFWASRARDVAPRTRMLEDVLGRAAERPAIDEHRYAARISLTPHGGAHRRDVVTAFGTAAPQGLDEPTLGAFVQHWVPDDPSGAVGVAEPLHRRREVVPGNHLLQALGPRPATQREHLVWLGAARAIESYRLRWDVRDTAPLGPDDAGAMAAMPTRRVADHVRVSREVETARAQLGRRPPLRVELGLAR